MRAAYSDPRLQEISDRLHALVDRTVEAGLITQEAADQILDPPPEIMVLAEVKATQESKESTQ